MKIQSFTKQVGRTILTWVWWVDEDGNSHTPELDPFRGTQPNEAYISYAWEQVQNDHTWEDFYRRARAAGVY